MNNLNANTLNKNSANQLSGQSFNRKVADNLVAPKVMVQKTKQELAYLKENPRPPSALPRKGGQAQQKFKVQADDDDDYSDDNYEENDFDEETNDDVAADKKLENLRKAMAREERKALRVV